MPVQISNWRAPCCTNISKPADYRDAARLGELEKGRFKRAVHHVENETRIQLIFCDGECLLGPRHAAGGGVNHDVKALLGEQFMLQRFGFCLARQSHSMLVGSIDDQHFRALLHKAKDSSACCASGSEHNDARTIELRRRCRGRTTPATSVLKP